MFSENNKISGRQLGRMIFVETSGTTAFLSLHIFGRYGSDGLIIMLWVYLFALLYTAGCFKLVEVMKNYSGGKIYGAISVLIRIFLMAKYLCVVAIVLNALSDVVKMILIPEVSSFIIVIVTLICVVYCVRGGIESRGRALEVLFYFVFIPAVIICIMLIPKAEIRDMVPTFDMSFKTVWMDFLVLIWLLVPSEMLVLSRNSYDNTDKVRSNVYTSITLSAAVNLGLLATALGVYGADSVESMERPVLKLMQISGIPGGFFNRQDGIISVFLIVSMFCSAWALIYHINELIKRTFLQDRKGYAYRMTVSAVILIVALVFVYDGKYKENIISADVGGTELEERQFVMSVIVDDTDDGLEFYFEIASSQGGSNEGGSVNVGSVFEKTKANSLKEAIDIVESKNGQHIDFSHMKALIMKKDVMEETDISKELIKEMSEDRQFGENIMICAMKGKVDETKEYGKNIEKLDSAEIYTFDKMYSSYEGSVTTALINNEAKLIGNAVVYVDVVEWELFE